MLDVEDDKDPLLGRVIDGRFTLQSVVGRGGMGVVYRAHQASLGRSLALKVMSGVPPDREAEFQRRFFVEAATAARLKHPNTITVFDHGSADVDGTRVFFIAMELVEGTTLSRALAEGRALPPERAIDIGLQICRSLREAHAAGVIHRDLKPANVMLVRDDDAEFVKVLDFGLAKTGARTGTAAGAFMGSPRYTAPEQVEGLPVDARADIYSFGCVLFRMLSGRVPFDAEQPAAIMLKQVREPAPPLTGVSPALAKLVADCLEKPPARRPASMDEVIARLKAARGDASADAVSVPPAPVPVRDWLAIEDSTRPTVYRRAGSTRPARARTPWRPIAAGVVVGLALSAGLLAWRLRTPRLPTIVVAPAPSPVAAPAPAEVAPRVHVRVKSTPPGADVIEMQGGLPRLLGVTPLVIDWQPSGSAPRELTLRKDGFAPTRATLTAPPPSTRDPWLDVDAVLRAE